MPEAEAARAGGDAAERCNRPDCGRGVIDDQGFCGACDRRPLERAPEPPTAPQVPPRRAGVGVAPVRSDPWYGLGLVEAAPLPDDGDDEEVPGAEAVGEEHRFCGNPVCREPVGRGHDGVPGRTAGFCPNCGTRFDFAQPHGLTIAGRYDVKRYLGSGAYGAAYLAHDRNLETDVVLKKLNNAAVATTADRERKGLVGLRHDAIVRILGYEADGPHLVLEYIPGATLSARPDDRLEFLLGHGVRILQALDYLHARGLLHCDVKPVNIIRFREESSAGPSDRVRLIDFGSVRSRKDTGPVTAYTGLYAPPEGDPEHVRPTPGFDLYCLGVTLKEVCRVPLRERTAPGIDSLHLLLDRATGTAVPRSRFVSARQFGEQLSGVIRQVVAARPTLRQVTRASALFGSMPEPLHGGLGAARPLDHWLTATLTEDEELVLPPAFTAPDPAAIVVALPKPLGDPDEPDLAEAAEGALAECRLALHRGDPDLAERALARSGLPSWHWLRSWYAGLVALARAHPAEATAHLAEVRAALPGELIPQLALGLCAELRGDLAVARSQYTAVFTTTPALGAAGFGLARVCLLQGRRAEAVDTAEQLAREFRYQREARVAAVRLLVTTVAGPDPGAGAGPTQDDLVRAREALSGLEVDTAAAAALRAELSYADYLRLHDRLALSETVRRLGPHVPGARDYTALVDLANALRPPLGRRWRRRRSRGRGGDGGRRADRVSGERAER